MSASPARLRAGSTGRTTAASRGHTFTPAESPLRDAHSNARSRAEVPAVPRAPLRGANGPAAGGAESEGSGPDIVVPGLVHGDPEDSAGGRDRFDPERVVHIRPD